MSVTIYYEQVEETIEEWCQVGTELIDDGQGGYVEIAIWEVHMWMQTLEQISHYIEVMSQQHTCPLPDMFLPEYVPPTPENNEGGDGSGPYDNIG